MIKARIYKSTGSWYDAEDENGKMWQARLKGKLRLKGLKTTNPIAVGDWVILEAENEQQALIKDIVNRENYVIRKSTRKAHHSHIIAANLDQSVLVATLSQPKTSLGFIDRFLVSCEAYHIPAILVFNKADLMDKDDLNYYEAIAMSYRDCGYQVLLVSAYDKESLLPLIALLEGKTSLFSGHSGVGKSSLLNQIEPSITQKTAEISDFSNKGKHTTTFAEMFELPNNTYIIDTPGIKEYGLVDISPDELASYFPEMQGLSEKCKFHNCTHLHEPGCAVLKALENDELPPTRYESYLSILDDSDNRR